MVVINAPVFSTWIIIIVLACLLLFWKRTKTSDALFSLNVTQELKGAAILMIVFSHIGYFLVSDHRFLWPLSTMAGVGVNLFLFLSAYGLSISNKNRPLGFAPWYKKRLPKLFVPLWIVIAVFGLMDLFILDRHYSLTYLLHSVMGYFPRADVGSDINSVFWYFTLILGYYLVFPLVFIRKHLWLSALLLLGGGYLFIRHNTWITKDVLKLYQVHYFAFPLGVLSAWAFSTHLPPKLTRIIKGAQQYRPGRYILILLLMIPTGYLAIHSGIGEDPRKEQAVSLLTMSLVIILFVIKNVEFRFLSLVGIYSYEIYLIHWPLLSRYDVFYKHIYAWTATILWLGILFILARLLNFTANNGMRIFKIHTKSDIKRS